MHGTHNSRAMASRSRASVFALCATLVACLAACAGASAHAGRAAIASKGVADLYSPFGDGSFPRGPYTVASRLNVPYGPLPAEVLDLCAPAGMTTPRPGIVLLHSSGFRGSDKSQSDTRPSCANFASQGFIVANVNYRLAPDNTWPAPLVDAQLAVRWLRAQARQLGLDANRLCASGPSFGGFLAVFLGALKWIHPGDEAGLLSDLSPGVSCVADFFGPVDYDPPAANVTGDLVNTAEGMLGGATPESDPALYADASPVDAVTRQSAPMLIVQGTQDNTVAPGQSRELQAALQAVGVPVEYLSYVGGHELTGLSFAQEQALWAQVLAFHVAYQHP
jgi:acetyl esterase/lipase